MSLNFDLRQVDPNTECYILCEKDDVRRGLEAGKKYISPLTETLIFCTMIVGLGSISEKNAVEFYARVSAWEKLHGAFLSARNEQHEVEDRPILLEEVKAHIGLKCNVTDITNMKFTKKLWQSYREELDRRIA